MRILVLGHVDHGKTTFICALNNVLFTKYGIGSADRAFPTLNESRQVTSQESVPYSLSDVNYTFVDYPGYADYLDMFEKGEEKFDAALLICALSDGPMPQTTDLFKKALEYGIDKFVVFMNKSDMALDDEMIEIITDETTLMMEEAGYTKNAPIVVGSASNALENPDSDANQAIIKIMSAVHNVCTQ